MEHEDLMNLERRREVAMQKIRPMVSKALDKMIERFEEEIEDQIIEALVDEGIDAPLDPDSNPEAIDESLGMVQKCIDEAVKYWHGSEHGPVYVLVGFNSETGGVKGLEVEIFGDRPRTWENLDDNWPKWFRVYCGNIDGGDSVLGDARGANFG